MSHKWMSRSGAFGTVLQSAMSTPSERDTAGRANGLRVRGVVLNVYVYDSEEGYTGGQGTDSNPINTIYVDVMCYGLRYNGKLPRVLWTHDRSGLHDGPLDAPRPTSFDVTGTFDRSSGSNPANWDGDHVIIGFLEDDLSQPYVTRCIPHPSSDIGNSELAVGHRMRLKKDDGCTRLWKHHGSVFGVDKDGNWLIDLRRAHTGEYEEDGKEPGQAKNGSVGNATVLLPQGSKFKLGVTKGDQTADSQDPNPDITTTSVEIENDHINVKLEGGNTTEVDINGGDITITNDGGVTINTTGDTTLNTDGKVHLGSGATHPVIHGDTHQTDQAAKNTPLAAHLNGITALNTALVTASTTPPGVTEVAMIPTIWAALLTFANGLALSGVTAGVAVTTFNSAIAAELSSDVDSK